jgi:hypothetical protein
VHAVIGANSKLTTLCRFVITSDGTFSATITARSAIALHIGALGMGSGTCSVSFSETATTTFGEVRALYLVMNRTVAEYVCKRTYI